MKDKNGIEICCENCACQQCGLNTYEHWRQACIEKDFADFNPSQTAYEKRIAELEELERYNNSQFAKRVEDHILKNLDSAPLAKPIEVDEYGNPFIAFSGWKIVFKEGVKFNELYVLAQSTDSDGFDSSVEIGHIEDVADKLQAAQDWLNKLVAQCAATGNPITQFTKAEVEAIRKIAQFMGVTVADSIAAKCEAMLEGADK